MFVIVFVCDLYMQKFGVSNLFLLSSQMQVEGYEMTIVYDTVIERLVRTMLQQKIEYSHSLTSTFCSHVMVQH
jgi:hypothetical protein